MMDIITPAFTKSLPKIELHAHLTGSITRECLHEIWMQRKLEQPDLGLRDPLEAIADDKIWDVMTFFPLFSSYIYELCSTIPSLVYSTNAVLRDFKDDGVVYLELRTTPRSSATISKDKYVETVLSCINDFPDRESMPTYLILSIDRRNTAEQAMEVIDLAIRYRTRGIVGVDLCGDPSKGDVSTFREAFVKAKQHGLKITLHFAETPASSSALELDTLLDYQPDRVGHVIHVSKEMQKEIIRKGIGVELCVSCNVQAKLIRGEVEDHHFGFWRDADCSVALCVSVGPCDHWGHN